MRLNSLWILLVIGFLGCSATQKAVVEEPVNPEVWVQTNKGPGARIAYGKTADMNCETPWLFDRGDVSPCRIQVEIGEGYHFVSLREKEDGVWEITGMYQTFSLDGIQKITIIELMDSRFKDYQ
jgi:hypothetical protein